MGHGSIVAILVRAALARPVCVRARVAVRVLAAPSRSLRGAQDAAAIAAPARAAAASTVRASLARGAGIAAIVDALVCAPTAATAAGVARGCAGALLPDPVRALGYAAGAIDGAPAGLAVLLSPAAAAPSPAMEVTAVAPARSLAGTAAAAAIMPAFVRRGEALHVRAPAGCVIDAISCIDGGTGGAVPVPHVSEGGGGCEASFAVGGSGSYAITGVCADGTRRFHRLSLTVDAPCPPPSVAVGGRAASRDACAPLTRGEAIEVLPPAWAEHGGGVGTIVAVRAGTPDVPLVLPCSGAELGDGLHMIVVTASLPGEPADLYVFVS